MIDDLANRLNDLQEMLAEGDINEAGYQRRLMKLRERYGAEAVDAALGQSSSSPPATTQSVIESENVAQASDHSRAAVISGSAQVGSVILGDIGGNVFITGQRGKDAATLLRGYLERQLLCQGIRTR